MKYVLFRKDRVKKLKTKLKKIAIQKDMGWCNDSRSTKYNKLINIIKYSQHHKFLYNFILNHTLS